MPWPFILRPSPPQHQASLLLSAGGGPPIPALTLHPPPLLSTAPDLPPLRGRHPGRSAGTHRHPAGRIGSGGCCQGGGACVCGGGDRHDKTGWCKRGRLNPRTVPPPPLQADLAAAQEQGRAVRAVETQPINPKPCPPLPSPLQSDLAAAQEQGRAVQAEATRAAARAEGTEAQLRVGGWGGPDGGGRVPSWPTGVRSLQGPLGACDRSETVPMPSPDPDSPSCNPRTPTGPPPHPCRRMCNVCRLSWRTMWLARGRMLSQLRGLDSRCGGYVWTGRFGGGGGHAGGNGVNGVAQATGGVSGGAVPFCLVGKCVLRQRPPFLASNPDPSPPSGTRLPRSV